MRQSFQALCGMPDALPVEVLQWQLFEKAWREVTGRYGYEEIRFPLLESTALFERSIGEETDIVGKEMFTLHGRDGESMTLRPEGTVGCARACLEHGFFRHQPMARLWYLGPMFRYERPQKGRFRQFHQAGVESFGMAGPDSEIEHILMVQRLWRHLGIESAVTLQVNSLGDKASRAAYRERLVSYFSKYERDLDPDSQRRLATNPLRILDSKNPDLRPLIEEAPKLLDCMDEPSLRHFEQWTTQLEALGVPFQVNPRLVRGLDYYNRTVYEWGTDQLGAQGQVCAGGRYDDLVEQLGGKPICGVGFAIGVERVLSLCEALKQDQAKAAADLDAYLICTVELDAPRAFWVAECLRDVCPTLTVLMNCAGGSLKVQLRRADKSGAKIALILGEAELAAGAVQVKFLREEREAQAVPLENLAGFLTHYLEDYHDTQKRLLQKQTGLGCSNCSTCRGCE